MSCSLRFDELGSKNQRGLEPDGLFRRQRRCSGGLRIAK